MLNFKKFSKLNENKDQKTIGFHITRKQDLDNIMSVGLEPRIPSDYGNDGDIKGVYLFKTLDDAENALMNWLGDRIEEYEDESGEEFEETLLVVDLTGLKILDTVEYEWTCLEHIKPDRILDTVEYPKSWDDIKNKYANI